MIKYTRVSQYYENSKYISNLFFVMLYTYILDDSIKSPTLILRADHSTILFLPGFFYQIKNFLFLMWVNLYMITGIYLHDPPPFNGPFFMTSPFFESQKVVTLLLFPPPSPLLISDKSLRMDRIVLGSIIILSACGMNETFYFSR